MRADLNASLNAAERRLPAKNDDIGGDVPRRTDERTLAGMAEHGNGRLRRDARDTPFDVTIDEDVADDEDVRLCKALDDGTIHDPLSRLTGFPKKSRYEPFTLAHRGQFQSLIRRPCGAVRALASTSDSDFMGMNTTYTPPTLWPNIAW